MKAAASGADSGRTARRLGMLLAAPPGDPALEHGLKLAEAACARGLEVYIYFIDEAVRALDHSEIEIEALRAGGARVYGCAYAAERRHLEWRRDVVYGGLALLGELMANTDRCVVFSGGHR
jgi:sulfur relay (sulfurtransferase) complex TusBCD TusD component (DsrE family)